MGLNFGGFLGIFHLSVSLPCGVGKKWSGRLGHVQVGFQGCGKLAAGSPHSPQSLPPELWPMSLVLPEAPQGEERQEARDASEG